jgi:hypothetical protein
MLRDISPDGIRISVPPGFQCKVEEDSTISVVFTLPEGERALTIEWPAQAYPLRRPDDHRGVLYRYRLPELPDPPEPYHGVIAGGSKLNCF